MYWIGGFLVVFFVIPNTTNVKERRAFSDERRLAEARAKYSIDTIGDSVIVVAGPYYDRKKFSTFFLGEKYRELWRTPVAVPVLDYRKAKGGLTPYDHGGNQQTVSIRLEDVEEKKWALRSVNKDQQLVLPGILRITFLRFLTRDQAASVNPYGQLVVPPLAEAVGIHHNSPQLVFVPYDSSFGEYNASMAGRLAYLEEHLNSSWKETERYGYPLDIVNTDEMLENQKKEDVPLDTLMYLRSRLFDMLIGDWDRHEGQWEWALKERGGKKIYEPLPKDRDNAFFRFDEGLFSHITLLFTKKFQSFRKEYGQVSGLMQQSRDLDKKMLSSAKQEEFIRAAEHIQQALTDEVIDNAFRKYPPEIYDKVGNAHADILKVRLKNLPDVSREFFTLINKKK
jgi:hypothetical protein